MNRSLNFICGKWHAWDGASGNILLSDEDTKTLRAFSTVDAAITWLYTNSEKDAARALNASKHSA